MASSYPGSVGAFQVGSYFVKQYYQVLQQQPDFVHQFYTDDSTVVRIDGDSSESASALLQIHALTMSLNFTGIEIKTINSLESWSGGILVVVSGSVKSRDFSGWRKFVQTFFLAPQETGYFVLNDIFHFVTEEEVAHQHTVPIPSENRANAQAAASSPLSESPVSDYALEETSEKLNSVHIEDNDPVEEYIIHEQQLPQQQEEEEEEEEYPEAEDETPAEESYGLPQNAVVAEQELPAPVAEEFTGEPRKFTYASILQASKGKPVPSVASTHPYRNKSTPAPATEWQQPPQPTVQPSNLALSYVPTSTVEVTEEGFSQDEGELKSVYVRNLPPTVSAFDLQQEFQKFGTIKPDGVFIRNRKEIGVCFAFVEFEDVEGVQNAIQASPIQLDDRQVYIEERRANSSGASRGGIGGRRGRGRGYPNEAPRGRYGGRSSGRGTYQDGGDYRSRGNGVHGSY